MLVVGEMNLIAECCFAMEIQGSAKHILGKENLAIMEKMSKR